MDHDAFDGMMASKASMMASINWLMESCPTIYSLVGSRKGHRLPYKVSALDGIRIYCTVQYFGKSSRIADSPQNCGSFNRCIFTSNSRTASRASTSLMASPHLAIVLHPLGYMDLL